VVLHHDPDVEPLSGVIGVRPEALLLAASTTARAEHHLAAREVALLLDHRLLG
jgi:hypothetical protein